MDKKVKTLRVLLLFGMISASCLFVLSFFFERLGIPRLSLIILFSGFLVYSEEIKSFRMKKT